MNLNRRTLLASAGAGAAVGMTNGFFAAATKAADDAVAESPNDSHVIGYIGTGIRFHTALGAGATQFGPCKMICDVDSSQAGVTVDCTAHRTGPPLDIWLPPLPSVTARWIRRSLRGGGHTHQ